MRSAVDHAVCTSGALLSLFVVDRLFIAPFVRRRVKPSDVTITRWFLVHAFANLCVVVTGLRPLWATMTDPQHAGDATVYPDDSAFGASSAWPLTYINSVHIYHMVGGFKLAGADYFHHLLFVPFLGFPGQILPWGPVQPAGAFFVSGLPGGVTYFMLGLCKLGLMRHIVEKRVTANLNSWVRVPGIVITSFVVYQTVLYRRNHALLTLWATVPAMLLGPFNALFYNKQAVANFSVHYMTSLLAQDESIQKRIEEFASGDSKATRMWRSPTSSAIEQAMGWKDAINVPQRGS